VTLQRAGDDFDDDADSSGLGEVVSSRYPFKKKEGWWMLIGNKNENSLLSIKRVSVSRNVEVSTSVFTDGKESTETMKMYRRPTPRSNQSLEFDNTDRLNSNLLHLKIREITASSSTS
jgi:hypothetical protein